VRIEPGMCDERPGERKTIPNRRNRQTSALVQNSR
jgi:hypothetical protein